MAALDPRVRAISSEIAHRTRWEPDADLTDLRRELALARVEARVNAAVADAPPLPPDLCTRLRELIGSAAAVGAVAA